MRLWRLVLSLVFMLPMVFAVQPVDLTMAVPLVAVIVGILLAAVNMMSKAIADPRLEAWAKTEVREFVVALILVGLISAVFISSSGISIALTGESNYVKVSQDILDDWIANYDSAFGNVIVAATKIRSAATYSPYINMPVWFFSINYSTNPLGGVALLLGSLNFAVQGITNALFLAEGIRLLVAFVDVTVPKILLPLAFVLRIIPFTRRTGNTLIAVSLAGIVFLPFGIILAEELNGVIDFPNPQLDTTNLDAKPGAMVLAEPLCESKFIRSLLFVNEVVFAAIVCLPLLLAVVTAGLYTAPCMRPTMIEIIYPLIANLFQLIMAGLMLGWETDYALGSGDVNYANGVFDAVHSFLRDTSNLVLVGYLDFILIGLVTITGAKSISAALGGEWYMAGIQRLI